MIFFAHIPLLCEEILMGERTTYRLWFFSLVLMAVLLLSLEFAVRQFGYAPGDVSPNWLNFQPVDSLTLYDDFRVNADGILVGNAAHHEVYGLKVNSDGFNSPEFGAVDTTRPTVMLIGDSFTWGMSATHNDSSYAAISSARSKWNVHNMGIPAADPVQYALVAEKYVPQLRPDLVVLFFFVGNDIMLNDREAGPYRDFYFFTNAGAILTEVDGIRFPDAHAAYQYFMHDKYWLTGDRNALEWLVSKSAVLSRIYSVRFRWEEKVRWNNAIKDLSLTTSYVMRVRDAALANGAAFRIVIIPEIKEAEMARDDYADKYGSFMHHPVLKAHITWPKTQKRMFEPYPDAHLNNYGHKVYAAFLMELLAQSGDAEK